MPQLLAANKARVRRSETAIPVSRRANYYLVIKWSDHVEPAPSIFYASQKGSDGASFERTSIEAPARLHRQAGQDLDFLLTAKREMAAAKRFFDKAMGAKGDQTKS